VVAVVTPFIATLSENLSPRHRIERDGGRFESAYTAPATSRRLPANGCVAATRPASRHSRHAFRDSRPAIGNSAPAIEDSGPAKRKYGTCTQKFRACIHRFRTCNRVFRGCNSEFRTCTSDFRACKGPCLHRKSLCLHCRAEFHTCTPKFRRCIWEFRTCRAKFRTCNSEFHTCESLRLSHPRLCPPRKTAFRACNSEFRTGISAGSLRSSASASANGVAIPCTPSRHIIRVGIHRSSTHRCHTNQNTHSCLPRTRGNSLVDPENDA
jgi:hypothetical protein